jgi:glycosyltransferase involved in cell wall biosynthesis
MRVAIVHEWLVTLGGSELVLAELLEIFPQAEIFALIDVMSDEDRRLLSGRRAHTSFLQRVPGIARRYRSCLPLFPAAVRSLDTGAFDVVISNSHAVAKGVRTRHGQLHICYCLSPMRYAWDLRDQYLRESGLSSGARGLLARALLDWLKRWDLANSADVDVFATLSHYIADRIRRAYGRSASVIYPPVDTGFFTPGSGESSGGYYITASRFVPYKRVDLIARAFGLLTDRRIIIVGDGPDAHKVRVEAGANVELVGRVGRERLRELLRGARAFIFAAEEDFGIAPVEAQACGIPVIAYGRGAALETVRGGDDVPPGDRTGVFFGEQTADSIAAAVRRFEGMAISPGACRANAERFTEERFRREFGALVTREWVRFAGRADRVRPELPAPA